MPNMRKLKEDALRRKHEFEELQRNEELQKQRKMSGGRRPRTNQGRHRSDQGRNTPANNKRGDLSARHQPRKKPKKTPARWIIDTLLVLGTLMVLVMLFNPY